MELQGLLELLAIFRHMEATVITQTLEPIRNQAHRSSVRGPEEGPTGPGGRLLALLALISAALLGAPSLQAQELTAIEGLGALSFPNSGAPAAQEPFIRGVLLLHSFEYDDAARAFRRAQEADPDFALAYWGEAMTHTHPLWNEKDEDAARKVLARLAPTAAERLARAPTEREKGWLRAVEVLYGEGDKARLDTLYALEMERLHDRYPDDLEAQTFYALSLLGLSQGDRHVPTYMEAGALALDAFEKNPEHPGAAHYTIHSFDDPTHAILAMEAAEAYAPLAPDAAHAQHMTSHIFLARGMWNEVVEANLRADAVVDRSRAARGLPPTDCGHYNQWLLYGYQQQGRYRDAESLLAGCGRAALAEGLSDQRSRSAGFSFVLMRNLYLADVGRLSGPARGIELPEERELPPVLAAGFAWGAALKALEAGDRPVAERQRLIFEENVDRMEPTFIRPYAPVWKGTLNALFLADAGDLEGALNAAEGAADYEASLPVDFGPPIAYKPARELVGDLLLELGRHQEALTAYQTALGRTPNRIHSLAGHARAAAAAGHPELARRSYRTLVELLEGADPEVGVAEEARAYLKGKE